jgi:sugar lactone lactonase YvrE
VTRRMHAALLAGIVAAVLVAPPARGAPPALATERSLGQLEVVATFPGPMPTGVTLSRGGRIFVNFPRWGDDVPFTVAELRGGKAVAYPSAELNAQGGAPGERLVSVQSVVVDPRDRLWILDTGRPRFGPPAPGGPKLVAVDLATNAVVRTIVLPPEVARPTTYLNDVRFDLRRGKDGLAFVTDSAPDGGLIVVDLASGESWRRLDGHPSVRAEPGFVAFVEGVPLLVGRAGARPAPNPVGADGLAISADGARLYYSPLSSRRLYSVATDALADRAATPAQVAATVQDHGDKPASDGLESDAEGRIYATAYEVGAIVRRAADGTWAPLARDPRLLWPDTLALAADGHLYVIANQLHRQPQFHGGQDRRQRPYALFRVRVDGTPLRLERR